jgi:DNA-binding NarL/FixJ family response regulator
MTASPDELVRAARAVAGGGTFVDPELALAVLRPDGSVGPGDLSDREVGVLRLIAVGYSNKEIAARLGVSVKTVETYKSRAMEKLKCRGRVDIVRYAARCGWFADAELPPPEYADLRPTAGPVDEVEPAGARGSR